MSIATAAVAVVELLNAHFLPYRHSYSVYFSVCSSLVFAFIHLIAQIFPCTTTLVAAAVVHFDVFTDRCCTSCIYHHTYIRTTHTIGKYFHFRFIHNIYISISISITMHEHIALYTYFYTLTLPYSRVLSISCTIYNYNVSQYNPLNTSHCAHHCTMQSCNFTYCIHFCYVRLHNDFTSSYILAFFYDDTVYFWCGCIYGFAEIFSIQWFYTAVAVASFIFHFFFHLSSFFIKACPKTNKHARKVNPHTNRIFEPKKKYWTYAFCTEPQGFIFLLLSLLNKKMNIKKTMLKEREREKHSSSQCMLQAISGTFLP